MLNRIYSICVFVEWWLLSCKQRKLLNRFLGWGGPVVLNILGKFTKSRQTFFHIDKLVSKICLSAIQNLALNIIIKSPKNKSCVDSQKRCQTRSVIFSKELPHPILPICCGHLSWSNRSPNDLSRGMSATGGKGRGR